MQEISVSRRLFNYLPYAGPRLPFPFLCLRLVGHTRPAAAELACASALDMIVFAGGVSLANSALTDMYNNTLAKWTPGPPLSIARRALTGVTWGTKLYFIGGFALAESGGAFTPRKRFFFFLNAYAFSFGSHWRRRHF